MNVTSTPPGTLTSPSTATPTTATPTGSSTLGENSFLQLLTAQLQNQDPLNPTSDSQFVAELAQFSSVEQMTTANSTLQQLVVGQASNNQTADASLVGRSVLYNTDQVSLTSGEPATLYANFGSTAASVTATVTNAQGQVVRTLHLGEEQAGQQAMTWDGLDDQGNPLPSGTYTVQISATDQSGGAVTVSQEARSLVTGISFQNSYPELVVSTGDIRLSDVNEIDLPS